MCVCVVLCLFVCFAFYFDKVLLYASLACSSRQLFCPSLLSAEITNESALCLDGGGECSQVLGSACVMDSEKSGDAFLRKQEFSREAGKKEEE